MENRIDLKREIEAAYTREARLCASIKALLDELAQAYGDEPMPDKIEAAYQEARAAQVESEKAREGK